MTNCSENVRKEIENLISEIEKLQQEETSENQAPQLIGFFSDVENELKRLLRTFDTRRFFIVTIGAMKAGKSTLINALTGNMVSPAGTGAETTLKCSVIMSADDKHPEGITLYRYLIPPVLADGKNSTVQQREVCREATRSLMDYFKGITEWNDDEYKNFERKSFALYEKDVDPQNEQKNLEYILTSPNLSGLGHFEDYLLAEIRIDVRKATVPGVLQDNLAIVDMPGVDGTLAGTGRSLFNTSGNPIDYLPEFCHLFLLVQSTVSGLNQTTAAMIKKWQAGKRKTPAYLVFNSINALSWYKGNSVDTEIKKAKDRALAELAKQNVYHSPGSIVVNAAKAWEASKPEDFRVRWKEDVSKDELYKESKIDELKEVLNTSFSKQKDEIILNDAVNNVHQSLEEFKKTAESLRVEASEQRECIIDESKFWGEVIACFDECFQQEDRESHCTFFDKKWTEHKEGVEENVRQAVRKGASANWLNESKTSLEQITIKAMNVQKALGNAHLEQSFSELAERLLKEWFDTFMGKLRDKILNLGDEEKWKDKSGNFKFRSQLEQVRQELKAVEWQEAREELKGKFAFTLISEVIDTKKLGSWLKRPWTKKGLISYADKFVGEYEDTLITDLGTTTQDNFRDACIVCDRDTTCLFHSRLNDVKKKLEDMKDASAEANMRKRLQYERIISISPKVSKGIEALENACDAFNLQLARTAMVQADATLQVN